MEDLAKQHTTERVAVQTCGPAVFMRQVQNAAAFNGWSIRTETFEF
jgi:ferredoxin-NADP reductase